jgi:hypothetical protein
VPRVALTRRTRKRATSRSAQRHSLRDIGGRLPDLGTRPNKRKAPGATREPFRRI